MGIFDFLFRQEVQDMDPKERDRYIASVENAEARGMKERADVKVIKGEDE